jgi:transcription elongation factor Elf1
MLRYDKWSCLKRAQLLLDQEDVSSLRYACLELRFCIEAVTYEKLNVYANYVPAKVFKKWQPHHALKMLLQFEPDADEDLSFCISPESELGKPTGNWINLGEYRTFKLNWLNKNYNRLGNYLHMEQNSISLIEDEEKINKFKNEIQEIASVLDHILNSDFVAPTIDIRVQFQCQACGHLSVANETVLLKTNHAICINPHCGAEYHATKENTERWSFKMIGESFKCLKCTTTNWIESRFLNIGTNFKCRSCGEVHQIIAGQWKYEQKSKFAT